MINRIRTLLVAGAVCCSGPQVVEGRKQVQDKLEKFGDVERDRRFMSDEDYSWKHDDPQGFFHHFYTGTLVSPLVIPDMFSCSQSGNERTEFDILYPQEGHIINQEFDFDDDDSVLFRARITTSG